MPLTTLDRLTTSDCCCSDSLADAVLTAMSKEETAVYDLDEWDPRWVTKQAKDRVIRRRQKQVRERIQREATVQAAQKSALAAVTGAAVAWAACDAADVFVDATIRNAAAAALVCQAAAASAADCARSIERAMDVVLARIAAAQAAAAAAAAAEAVAVIAPQMRALLPPLLVQYLQDLVIDDVGERCPDIEILLPKRRIDLNRAIGFAGGAAIVAEESMPMVVQIQTAVRAIWDNIILVNDLLER
jgi:hypothetical protein